MRKKLTAAVTGLLLSVPLTAVPSNADTIGCVARGEYRAVERGWSKGRVHRVFDTRGRIIIRLSDVQIRWYNACGTVPNVEIRYLNRGGVWRVATKNRL